MKRSKFSEEQIAHDLRQVIRAVEEAVYSAQGLSRYGTNVTLTRKLTSALDRERGFSTLCAERRDRRKKLTVVWTK